MLFLRFYGSNLIVCAAKLVFLRKGWALSTFIGTHTRVGGLRTSIIVKGARVGLDPPRAAMANRTVGERFHESCES